MRPRTNQHPDTGYVTRSKVTRNCRGCGKVAYSSRKLAAAAVARIRRQTGDQALEVYHDYGCHALHIGHRPVFDPEKARGTARVREAS